MRAAKVQARLRGEPSLLAHTSSESRGTFRQKARSLAPLNGWACAVKVCHDGMLEDTNSLGAVHFIFISSFYPRFGQKSQENQKKCWPYHKISTLSVSLAGILNTHLSDSSTSDSSGHVSVQVSDFAGLGLGLSGQLFSSENRGFINRIQNIWEQNCK